MPKIPDCPPAPPVQAASKREFKIELLTPLFGGGVVAAEPDPTMPIRGTAIRGQLQFWWRATRGAACADIKELRERHRAVWGATESASPVSIDLVDVKASEPTPCGEIVWNPQARQQQGAWRLQWHKPFAEYENLPYILFPFQGVLPPNNPRARIEEAPASCLHLASFTLRLRFPAALQDDVETAVCAWVNFGGLGARTRRGCGALLCKELAPPTAEQVKDWFRTRILAPVPQAGASRPWSVVPNALLARLTVGKPLDVWNRLTGLFKFFRQGENFGRNKGKQANRPGRSRYPEPESIRRATSTRAAEHARLDAVPEDAYPRAEFGLPIVFHFQGRGDPVDTVLYPVHEGERQDRLASPLILKPLALANGQAVPLVLPLVAPSVAGVDLLRGETPIERCGVSAVQDPRLESYAGSPLRGLSKKGSALEAFLAFVKQAPRSFEEIKG